MKKTTEDYLKTIYKIRQLSGEVRSVSMKKAAAPPQPFPLLKISIKRKDKNMNRPFAYLIKPGYVTNCFGKLLAENGLRKIRFHDLRHSCASLLLANGVQMKQIQEWLGHSDFSTTANIYSHLEYSSKLISADSISQSLKS